MTSWDAVFHLDHTAVLVCGRGEKSPTRKPEATIRANPTKLNRRYPCCEAMDWQHRR